MQVIRVFRFEVIIIKMNHHQFKINHIYVSICFLILYLKSNAKTNDQTNKPYHDLIKWSFGQWLVLKINIFQSLL